MKKFYSTIIMLTLTVAALSLTACRNGTMKEHPMDMKSDSSAVGVSDHPITDKLYAELDSAEVYNDSILFGYWFKPHEANSVNVFFHKDNTYEFKYYIVPNDSTIIDVVKKGTYTIDGEVIRLIANDGWDEKEFDGIMYHKNNGTNYYLTDKYGELYLVKGSD